MFLNDCFASFVSGIRVIVIHANKIAAEWSMVIGIGSI